MKAFLAGALILLSLVAASFSVDDFDAARTLAKRPSPRRFVHFDAQGFAGDSSASESESYPVGMPVNNLLDAAEPPIPHNRRYLDVDSDDDGSETDEFGDIEFDAGDDFYQINEAQENIPSFLSIRSFSPFDHSASDYIEPFRFSAHNVFENYNYFQNEAEQPAEYGEPVVVPCSCTRQPRCRVSSGTSTLMLLGLQKDIGDLDSIRGPN